MCPREWGKMKMKKTSGPQSPGEIIEISDSDSDDRGTGRRPKKCEEKGETTPPRRNRKRRTPETEIIDLTNDGGGGGNAAIPTPTRLARERDYKKAKRTLSRAISTREAAAAAAAPGTANPEHDGRVWRRLRRILDDPRCRGVPSGPSRSENRLLSRVSEYGITPYGYEVPLGNGVSDCVGHDGNGRLCVVEAKCLRPAAQARRGGNDELEARRRAKLMEQTAAYAAYLSKETGADVAAYSFDDQDGMTALQSFGIFRYDRIKDYDPRAAGQGSATAAKGIAKRGRKK